MSRSEIAERETARLDEWLNARFEKMLDFSPVRKTMLGRKDDYDRIDDLSEAAQDEQRGGSDTRDAGCAAASARWC